jgi:hypothetical protein
MRLTIPKRHENAFAALVGLSATQSEALAAAIAKAKPTTSLSGLTAQISGAKTGLSRDELRNLIDMLASLYRLRTDLEAPASDIATALIELAKDDAAFPPPRQGWEELKGKLTKIFDADKTLGLTAKASELYYENERTLCPANCRILTDVRPVFLGGADTDPDSAIVQHTLKLAYHKNDELRHLYVSLDLGDIEYLQDVLERAALKEHSLRRRMAEAEIDVLDEEDAAEEPQIEGQQ